MLKQDEELVFDCIGFFSDFLSLSHSVSINTAARTYEKSKEPLCQIPNSSSFLNI